MIEKHDPKEILGPVLKESNKEFEKGLKLLLDSHEKNRLEALAAWPGELTDPDKAFTINNYKDSLDERNKKLLEELKERFADDK